MNTVGRLWPPTAWRGGQQAARAAAWPAGARVNTCAADRARGVAMWDAVSVGYKEPDSQAAFLHIVWGGLVVFADLPLNTTLVYM